MTGDEILVGFNAPFDQPNAPYLALKTAITMQQKFNELRQSWFKRMDSELGLGIGVHLGDVVMGNVGAKARLSFRMVGEAMNKAHRLVDLAEDGQIIISDAVYRALQQSTPRLLERVKFESMGSIELKGIDKPQILYCTRMSRTPLQR